MCAELQHFHGDWRPCSDRSLERADPLAGTASRGDRWFLIEIDGAWDRNALLQSLLPHETAVRILRRIETAGMRALAIRRTGLRADERRARLGYRWASIDARVGNESVRWGRVEHAEDLDSVPLDGSTGAASDRPVYCVCTHARHDQCCAVRGRPVVEALARVHPDRTWECSHLGGDRFAATMMIFPHALNYGRLAPAEAVEAATRHENGRLLAQRFRGRASLSRVAQAAEAFERDRSGDDRIDAYTVLSEFRDGHHWTVLLDHGGKTVTVHVADRMSQPLLSTCRATVAMPVPELVASPG